MLGPDACLASVFNVAYLLFVTSDRLTTRTFCWSQFKGRDSKSMDLVLMYLVLGIQS